jgi:hypothetical protein
MIVGSLPKKVNLLIDKLVFNAGYIVLYLKIGDPILAIYFFVLLGHNFLMLDNLY